MRGIRTEIDCASVVVGTRCVCSWTSGGDQGPRVHFLYPCFDESNTDLCWLHIQKTSSGHKYACTVDYPLGMQYISAQGGMYLSEKRTNDFLSKEDCEGIIEYLAQELFAQDLCTQGELQDKLQDKLLTALREFFSKEEKCP